MTYKKVVFSDYILPTYTFLSIKITKSGGPRTLSKKFVVRIFDQTNINIILSNTVDYKKYSNYELQLVRCAYALQHVS